MNTAVDLNALSETDACELRDMQLHEEAEGLVREVLRGFKTSQGRWPRTVDEIRRWIRQTPEIITAEVAVQKAEPTVQHVTVAVTKYQQTL